MNKVAATVAGVVSIALGTLETLPAVAGTIAFDYRDGYANGTLEVDSTVSDLANNMFGIDLGIERSMNLNLNASDLTGSFSLFDDPEQFTDGDITLDYDVFSNTIGLSAFTDDFSSMLGDLDAGAAAAFADSFLSLALSGTGTIDAGDTSTNFNLNYVSDTNSIVINGFDADVVSQCLTLTCTTTGQGGFGLGVELSVLTQLALGFGLPETFVAQITALEASGLSALSVASGSFNFGITTDPGAVDPDGEELYATVTGGTVSVSETFEGEEITIVERSFDEQIVTQSAPQAVPEPGLIFGLLGVGAGMRGIVKRQGN